MLLHFCTNHIFLFLESMMIKFNFAANYFPMTIESILKMMLLSIVTNEIHDDATGIFAHSFN